MERLGDILNRLSVQRRAPAGAPAPEQRPPACAICHDRKWLWEEHPEPGGALFPGRVVPCGCLEHERGDRLHSELLKVSNLDSVLDKTFANFEGNMPGVRDAYNAAVEFADSEHQQGWLVLEGPYGCGKTHLAAAIANAAIDSGTRTLFTIVPDLLDHLRATFMPNSDQTYDELFEAVRQVPLLIMDDLGSENTTPWATEKLYQIINHRYNHRLPTVITTNDDLLNGLDKRIESRINDKGLTRIVKLTAGDYRKRVPSQRRQRVR